MAKDKAKSHLRFSKTINYFLKLVIADLWASRPLTFADSRLMFASVANILGAAARRQKDGLSASVISSQTVGRYAETHYDNEGLRRLFFCRVLCYFRVAKSEHRTSLAIYNKCEPQ